MRKIACGGRNPRSSLSANVVSMCVALFRSGATLRATALAVESPVDAVARAVRRNIPNAWRRQTSKGASTPGTVQRIMPHHVSWSTDPVQSHAVTLPRLRCLGEHAAC
jgi:hypothetical protein